MSTPGAKYDHTKAFSQTKAKIFSMVIAPAKDIGVDKYKIVKDKSRPDCGTYEGMDSFKNT